MSTSTTAELPRMDADAFITWRMEQPEGEHYELHDGVVIRRPNEGALHGETKSIVSARLLVALQAAGLNGQVFGGEMAVDFGRGLVFEPDVVVRFGDRLPPRVARVLDPAIVVEVLSPSTQRFDFGIKLDTYLAVPTLHHYLIVDAERRRVIHHRRGENSVFLTTIHGDGPLTLDPPGIVIDRLFP